MDTEDELIPLLLMIYWGDIMFTRTQRLNSDDELEYEDELKVPLLYPEQLHLSTAVVQSAYFALPFALSRVAGAIQSLGNGIILTKLNNQADIAAAPVMFMVQLVLIGTTRGALSSMNAVVGTLNGEMKYDRIGPAVNQALLLGLMLGVPVSVLFYTASDWLKLMGVDESVAEHTGQYLRALSYAVIPTLLSFVDQQLLFSIKRTRAPIVLNTLLIVSSMLIGFPAALIKSDLNWVGYGALIGASLAFLTGRTYLYLNKKDYVHDRMKYNIFTRSLDSGTRFKELLDLSFPMALQAMSEWLPTLLIAFITAHAVNSELVLEAEEPSMVVLLMFNQILLGFGTAATVSVANALGRAKAYAEQKKDDDELVWKTNARTIGYSNVIVTGLTTLPFVIFLTAYPGPIVRLFTEYELAYPLAEQMLRIVGASLLLDGIRNTTTGAFLGRRNRADNFFTSMTNLLITAAAATALGYFTEDSVGHLSYFGFRMLGIFMTASVLLIRWDMVNQEYSFTNTRNTLFGRPLIQRHSSVVNYLSISQDDETEGSLESEMKGNDEEEDHLIDDAKTPADNSSRGGQFYNRHR
jgi:Na+-driven multidrug efflux pump